MDNGRVVKGTNFADIRDAGDPVELAERYDAEGADELVFLDITASHEAVTRSSTWPVEPPRMCSSLHDRRRHPFGRRRPRRLERGGRQGRGQQRRPEPSELLTELAAVFGSQCVVIAIDAKRNEDGNYGGLPQRRPGRDGTRRDRVGNRGHATQGPEKSS